jgi:hypothetical protein
VTTPVLDRLVDPTDPFRVPSHIGRTTLFVPSSLAAVQAVVGATMHQSVTKLGLRIAGGCSNMTREFKDSTPGFFLRELAGFRGLVSSGATRDVDDDGKLDIMVTDVPAYLAAQRPNDILTISTAPVVGDLGLVDKSRLVIGDAKYGNDHPVNPGVHMVILFQAETCDQFLDWNGDLDYVDMFNLYVRRGGWQFATIVWNGGGVTREEAVKAALRGWPVFLVEGTGRAADQMLSELNAGTLVDHKGEPVNEELYKHFVPVTLAEGHLHSELARYGFVPVG